MTPFLLQTTHKNTNGQHQDYTNTTTISTQKRRKDHGQNNKRSVAILITSITVSSQLLPPHRSQIHQPLPPTSNSSRIQNWQKTET
jgi:hypothetical protein